MKLQEGIKLLVGQFGQGIVVEVRLANLLADINGYEEYPAMKPVFKEILKEGFGEKIYNSYCWNHSVSDDELAGYIELCVKETGFKEDLVGYGFDSILYGLGVLQMVTEPLSKGYNPKSKPGDILDTMDERLITLKGKYLKLLDSLITKPCDLLHNAPAYYSAEAQNKLYAVESKIAVLLQAMGKNDDSGWCQGMKNSKLAKYRKQKEDAIKKMMDEEKAKYAGLLESNIIKPCRLFIKMSGYYDGEGLRKLSIVEDKIKLIYGYSSIVYDNWCEKAKNACLERHKVKTSKIIAQAACKLVIPTAFFTGISLGVVSYIASLDSIQRFNKTIALGEQQNAAEQYGKSIQLFNEAKTNYDGSFSKWYYKDIADGHIKVGVDNAVAACNRLITEGRLKDASVIIKSLPEKIIDGNADNADKVNAVQARLDKVIDEGLNNLISNIYMNKGRLDEKSRKLLDELLAVNSDTYWLNFIKGKER